MQRMVQMPGMLCPCEGSHLIANDRSYECTEQPWAGTVFQRSDDILGKPGLCAILEADGGIRLTSHSILFWGVD